MQPSSATAITQAEARGAVEPTGGLVRVYGTANHRLASGAGGVQLFERVGGVPGVQGSRVPRDSLWRR